MELRAGQRNYLNAITSGFDETQLIYYAIKTQCTVLLLVVKSLTVVTSSVYNHLAHILEFVHSVKCNCKLIYL